MPTQPTTLFLLLLVCIALTSAQFFEFFGLRDENAGAGGGAAHHDHGENGGWGYNPSDLSTHHPKAWIVPRIFVTDVKTAADFYTKAFGLEKRAQTTLYDGTLIRLEMSWKDDLHRFLFLEKENEQFKSPTSTRQEVRIFLTDHGPILTCSLLVDFALCCVCL